MAIKELFINQILCATLKELKDYAITNGITLPSSATIPMIQGQAPENTPSPSGAGFTGAI